MALGEDSRAVLGLVAYRPTFVVARSGGRGCKAGTASSCHPSDADGHVADPADGVRHQPRSIRRPSAAARWSAVCQPITVLSPAVGQQLAVHPHRGNANSAGVPGQDIGHGMCRTSRTTMTPPSANPIASCAAIRGEGKCPGPPWFGTGMVCATAARGRVSGQHVHRGTWGWRRPSFVPVGSIVKTGPEARGGPHGRCRWADRPVGWTAVIRRETGSIRYSLPEIDSTATVGRAGRDLTHGCGGRSTVRGGVGSSSG